MFCFQNLNASAFLTHTCVFVSRTNIVFFFFFSLCVCILHTFCLVQRVPEHYRWAICSVTKILLIWQSMFLRSLLEHVPFASIKWKRWIYINLMNWYTIRHASTLNINVYGNRTSRSKVLEFFFIFFHFRYSTFIVRYIIRCTTRIYYIIMYKKYNACRYVLCAK